MWGKRAAVSHDDLRRVLYRLDEVLSAVEELKGTVHVLDLEWAETRDQVKRSYNRVEASERRLAKRQDPAPPERPADEALDPFSKKMRQIREGTNDAIQPGNAESSG